MSPLLTRKAREQLREETSRQFAQMNISLDVRKMMGSLVGLELREVEVVKAKKIGARILVVEDECEDMNVEAIREYAQLLKKAAKNRMAVILLCHSNLAASILSDSYVIFRRGRVVKKSKKEFSPD
ncbi:MAG: hypothetical protein LUE86_05950, partial [Clostridiales bacterium]|nr:hypothetical protein [Clostridiales bacterium]